MRRSSGIILPIFSLPSPHGIGTFGREAYEFADFLAASRQKYWQILPLGPTGYGDSPYQSFSSFAGNPYFIDLDKLAEQGLLTRAEIEGVDWGTDGEKVDYGKIYANRFPLLEKAFARFQGDDELDAWIKGQNWLFDYALFTALKDHFDGAPWIEWPDEEIRLKKPEAVQAYARLLAPRLRFYCFLQYLFFEQWNALREYVRNLDIGVIGDLPIYVPLDSADCWSNPEVFWLDGNRKPIMVAGVPPDVFNADGQLWGNPLYDWDYLAQTGYSWWMARTLAAASRFDVIRLDHFRGFCDYYAVPYGAATAREGEWKKGPGRVFIDRLKHTFPHTSFIAEDLGFLTREVHALREYSGFMGMKVLQFAFNAGDSSDYLPHKYPRNCACYTGTHDNTTARGWFDQCKEEDREYAVRYLGLSQEEGFHWGLIRGGMGSVADLFVAQMQDVLGLGDDARTNRPGEGQGNWQFRIQRGACTAEPAERIAKMTRMFGR
ncbi:MAG: 4-alpha-glucanotransferase [Christensenellales bacterium]|jgi:4-alpha-glucanotransferase